MPVRRAKGETEKLLLDKFYETIIVFIYDKFPFFYMDYIFYVSFLYVCYRKNGFFSVFGKFLDSTAPYKNCMNRGWNIKKKKRKCNSAHFSCESVNLQFTYV